MCGCVLKLSQLCRHILLFPQSQDLDINRKSVPGIKASKFTSFSNFLLSELTSICYKLKKHIYSQISSLDLALLVLDYATKYETFTVLIERKGKYPPFLSHMFFQEQNGIIYVKMLSSYMDTTVFTVVVFIRYKLYEQYAWTLKAI